MNLPIFPQDKAMHFIYGVVISAIISAGSSLILMLTILSTYKTSTHLLVPAILGILFAALAGIGKELLDKKQNASAVTLGLPPIHSVESKDAVYTIVGGIFPAIPMIISSIPLLSGPLKNI
jgi:hypothetical protein